MLSIKPICSHLQSRRAKCLKLNPSPWTTLWKMLLYPARQRLATTASPPSPNDLNPRDRGKRKPVDELGARYSLAHPWRAGRGAQSLAASRLPVSQAVPGQVLGWAGSPTEPPLNLGGPQSAIPARPKEMWQGQPVKTQLHVNRGRQLAAKVRRRDPLFSPAFPRRHQAFCSLPVETSDSCLG